LNAIKLEYKNIDNISLQNVRINISGRYHEVNDIYGNLFPPHPLNGVEERIHRWIKPILLGLDDTSWKVRRPNVTCAHMCINFEETEFVQNHLGYTGGVKSKYTHHNIKTIIPMFFRKTKING